MYDSPTDKTKVVIEYCAAEKCDRILIDAKALKEKKTEDVLRQWLGDRIDERQKQNEKF